jgi:hypothetical protein
MTPKHTGPHAPRRCGNAAFPGNAEWTKECIAAFALCTADTRSQYVTIRVLLLLAV